MNQDFFLRSIKAIVAQEIQEEFAQKPIKSLGEVILLLQAQPSTNTVKLDFTQENPVGLESYRGYYKDLSLDYTLDASPKTVKQLLKMFKDADGNQVPPKMCADVRYLPTPHL